MKNESELAALTRYIRSHGHDVIDCDATAGTLFVVSAVCLPGGGVEMVTETIPATMQAVRDWLGY